MDCRGCLGSVSGWLGVTILLGTRATWWKCSHSFHCMPLGLVKFQSFSLKCWDLFSCLWEHMWVHPLCRAIWLHLAKLRQELPSPPPAIPCLCLYPGRAPLWVLFMIGKIEVTQVFISRKWAHGNVLIKWNTWQRLSGNLSYMRQHTWISQIQCNPKMYKSRFFWCHLHNVFKCVMSIIGNPM